MLKLNAILDQNLTMIMSAQPQNEPIAKTIQHVAALRARLWDSGFRPVPIYNHDSTATPSPGKAPMGEEWTERARKNPPEAAAANPRPEALNTGILCDGLRPVDIDIDNPTIAAAVKSRALTRFGECPMRFRDSGPRSLLLYRAAQGEPKKRAISGSFGKVEILGRGQQFVAFGMHHSGSRLQWLPEAPGDIEATDLPAITEEALTAFLMDAAALIGAKPEAARTDTSRIHTSAHGLRADSLQVLTALHSIPNNGPADWEFWNRIGMAIWAATGGSEAGRAAFHAWSEEHAEYDSQEADRRWDHYAVSPPGRIGAGTLFHMAKQRTRETVQEPEPAPIEEPAQEKPTEQAEASDAVLWELAGGWDEASIERRPWVAPGYLLRGAITILSGNPSAGKSSMIICWAIALALGIPFGKFKPRGAMRILLYNVEDDEEEQKRRISAACRQFGITPYDLKNQLVILGPKNIGTLIQVQKDGGFLVNTSVMDELDIKIKKFDPDVIMLDPFVELHTAEENDNTLVRAVMARFRQIAKESEAAEVILYHSRKGPSSPGDPDSIRGASAIVGAGRIAFTITIMSEEEAASFAISSNSRRDYFRLDDAKKNYSRLEDAEWFERVEYTLENSSDDEPGDGVAAIVPWSPPKTVITQELIALAETVIAQGSPIGPWSPRVGREDRSVAHAFTKIGVTESKGQKLLLDQLLATGTVVAEYRRPGRSAKEAAHGLRTSSGAPKNVDWL